MKEENTATIFDVAERAGVSIKTVSRVVNNEPNVRDNTREKVSKAIEELKYRPNTAARSLSGKRSYVIGLIYENADEFSYTKNVLNGALNICESLGYTLLLRPLTVPHSNLRDTVRQFVSKTSIDGVLLPAPVGDLVEVTDVLAEFAIPTARITPKVLQTNAISVLCDDTKASFELTAYLISQGHKNIGFIKGHPDHSASANRYAGYQQALQENNLSSSKGYVQQGYFDFESGKQAAKKMLQVKQPPSAIVASNDDMAAGVMFAARDMGIEIPAQLSVVGFDDTPVASHLWPPLTTVRQPITSMAETATSLLIAKLQGEAAVKDEDPFHCELVVRASTSSIR